MDCIFCKIINREEPGVFVYEDKDIVAIEPKDKVSADHLLVLLKTHYRDVFDIDESILRDIISVGKKLSKDIVAIHHTPPLIY